MANMESNSKYKMKNRKFNIICKNFNTIFEYIKSLSDKYNISSYFNFYNHNYYPDLYEIDNSEQKRLNSLTEPQHNQLDIETTYGGPNVKNSSEQVNNDKNCLDENNLTNIKLHIDIDACQNICENTLSNHLVSANNVINTNNDISSTSDDEYDIV